MKRMTDSDLVRLVLRRLGQMLPTAFLTTVLTLLLIHLVPGGPADVVVLDDALEVVQTIVGGVTRVAG